MTATALGSWTLAHIRFGKFHPAFRRIIFWLMVQPSYVPGSYKAGTELGNHVGCEV